MFILRYLYIKNRTDLYQVGFSSRFIFGHFEKIINILSFLFKPINGNM